MAEMNNRNGVLSGLEFMGDNIRKKLKFCGKGVRLYALSKMIRAENAMLDDYVTIVDNVWIDAGKSLKIGKHTILTWFVMIEGGANTEIGDRVFIGPGSKILTGTYALNGVYTCETVPDDCHKVEFGDVRIEDDAYLGANCVVMPGVTIGEGAVVGANAFVNKDLEPWGIYVGNPCKKTGERQKPTEEMQKKVMEMTDWSRHFDVNFPEINTRQKL